MASVPGSPLNLEGGRKEATWWVPQEGGGGNWRFRLLPSLPGQGPGCQESDCSLERGVDPGAGTTDLPFSATAVSKVTFFFQRLLSLFQFREKKRETKEEGRWRGRVSIPAVQ